jgi:DNA-directed RNA polymerase specialized sigma24 family protein
MNTNQNLSPVSSPAAVLEDRLRDGAPDSSNDNSSRRGVPDTTALVGRAEVVAVIGGVLRDFRIPSQDMPDAMADVQLRAIALARKRAMPANLEQWKALARTLAVRWALKRKRQARDRRKYNVGPCEDADVFLSPTLHWEHRDPVDTKRYLAILKELFDSGQMPELGQEILQDAADGVSARETALEIGISEPAVRKRLFRMRVKFAARLSGLGMLTLLLMLFAFAHVLPGNGEVAAPAPSASSAETAAPDAGVGYSHRYNVLTVRPDADAEGPPKTCTPN